ncbi:MAG: sigma 54-interacting transcriptional regulator [Acidobacteriota bacterium]
MTASLTRTSTHSAMHWAERPAAVCVPGLTVLYHPDPERIGERTVLEGVGGGRSDLLSRHAPEFAAPGGPRPRPLADRSLSRTPLVVRAGAGDSAGGVVIERGTSRTRLWIAGTEVADTWVASAADLDDGVVLRVGSQVVLLLHRLDPVADTDTPRFGLVGESPAMARLRRDIVQTADLRVPILLRGESGTGKELAARAIHDAGPRRERPYVAVNMGALPPSLAASELFGAERGAYTGADRRRSGHFERAHGGTLFLDEVGETPLEVQALLLRVLETGEVQSVGGSEARRLDVRIVSATDADLDAAIEADRFRAPLLHRLSGYIVRLPPLRRRREDFGRLLRHFLQRELDALGKLHRLAPRPRPWLPAPLIARLAAWHWPGNVRQLANTVRQLVIANRDLEAAVHFDEVERLLERAPSPDPDPVGTPPRGPSATPRRRPGDLTEADVVAAMRAYRFRPAAAADALGIPRSSIYDLIARIPGLRKAADLTRAEIDAARARVGSSIEAIAEALEVSPRALRRRLGQLDP